MKQDKRKILWISLAVLGAVLLSSGSGAVSGYVAANLVLDQKTLNGSGIIVPNGTSTQAVATNTDMNGNASTSIKLVPLSILEASPRLVPESILDRESSVGILYASANQKALMLGEDDVAARAVAMTTDGWFAVPYLSVKDKINLNWHVWYDNRLYPVTKKIADESVGMVFIKVDNARLSVASFAQNTSKRSGFPVWLEPGPMQFIPSAISSLRRTIYGEPRLSDVLTRRMVAVGQIAESEIGAPVWDTNGALVGIVESGEGNRLDLIPASVISASLQSLISKQKIEHAALGVRSMPTSFIRSLDPELELPERGEWIYSTDPKLAAILTGSAAERAGLKTGDVILQVDRDIIDESVDLGDIILQFVPGAEVNIRVWRQGEEIDIPVVLGSKVTSKEL